MPIFRLILGLVAFAGLGTGQTVWAKKSKGPSLSEIIATPQHLKESLSPTTILLTKLKVRPAGPEVAKAILDAGLDQATQFVSFPDENASEPEPVKRVAPEFPYDLRRRGVSGAAKFLMLIAADGTVKSLYCYQNDHPKLAVAAAEALTTWKFKPARVKGVAVPVLVNQTLEFMAD